MGQINIQNNGIEWITLFKWERRSVEPIDRIHDFITMDPWDATIIFGGTLASQVKPEWGPRWKDFLLHSLVHIAGDFGIDVKTSEAQSYEMVHFHRKVD